MDTWIASDDNPETVNIRDDGAEAKDAVLDKDGIETEAAAPTRKPWPAKHEVKIRAFPSGIDMRNFTLWAQWAHDENVSQLGAEAASLMVRIDASVAIAAVMTEGFVGKMFTSKATGTVLEMPPTATGKDAKSAALARMATIRTLPQAVIRFIAETVSERVLTDPLG